jgi:hypothetical protein
MTTEPLKTTQTGADLYEQDFYAWTQVQGQLLRAGRLSEADIVHIAEEIEDMGKEQGHALESALFQAMVHLLKLQFSPATDPRHHWRDEVDLHREEAEERLHMNPGLRPRLNEFHARAWRRARRLALVALARDGVTDLPWECPYTLEQVLDQDWWPVP